MKLQAREPVLSPRECKPGYGRCPSLLPLIRDQYIFPIEEEDVEFFDVAVCDLCIAIVDQLVP